MDSNWSGILTGISLQQSDKFSTLTCIMRVTRNIFMGSNLTQNKVRGWRPYETQSLFLHLDLYSLSVRYTAGEMTKHGQTMMARRKPIFHLQEAGATSSKYLHHSPFRAFDQSYKIWLGDLPGDTMNMHNPRKSAPGAVVQDQVLHHCWRIIHQALNLAGVPDHS